MAITPTVKQVTVATAGTPVAIGNDPTGKPVVSAWVQAVNGVVWVGDSTVLASTKTGIKLDSATNDKIALVPDQTQGIDLAKVYIDGVANGAIASILYFEKQSR